MGDRIIPLSETVKVKVDVVAGGGAVLGYFQTIPWPELAACAAFIYTVARLIEMVYGWIKKK